MIAAQGSQRALYALMVALVVTLPFMDLEVFQIVGKSIVLPYVVLGALALASFAVPDMLRAYARSDSALPFLFAWLFVAACSSALAFLRTQQSSLLFSNFTQLAMLAFMAAHYFFISATLRTLSPRQLFELRNIFIVTACFGTALSLYQIGHVVWGWPYADVLRTSNLYHKANTLTWHGGGSWISLPRPYGSSPEPTFWAAYLAVALGFALVRVGEQRRPRYVAEAAFIALGLILTFARAAIPPLIAMLCVWVFSRRRLPRWIVPALLAATIVVTLAPGVMSTGTLTVFRDRSAVERISAQITGLRMVSESPWIGVGPGSVTSLVDRYLYVVEERQSVAFSYLYSFLLNVVVTTGLLGAILFVAYLLEVGRHAYQSLVDCPSPALRFIPLSALLLFVYVTVYWIVSPVYNMSFLWFALAFGSASPKQVAAAGAA